MTQFNETATMRKVYGRLMPLLFAMMFFNYLDRINIGFAALDMNRDLGFSPAVFGFAGSIFFVGYMLLEVPSNLLLHRVGARRWIARILLTWGAPVRDDLALLPPTRIRSDSGGFVLRHVRLDRNAHMSHFWFTVPLALIVKRMLA